MQFGFADAAMHVQDFDLNDPICQEVPETLPEFAPRDQRASISA